MAQKQMGTDFTRGNITGHLVRFMLPLLLAGVLNSLYNMVDMVIIGRFAGTAGNVAVSTGGKVLMMLTVFSTAIAGAGQVVIGQLAGKDAREELGRAIGTLFSLLLVISVALSIISVAVSRCLIGWLHTPAESFDGALAYMRITGLGLIFISGYNVSCAVMRGMGDSVRPLLFIAIAAGVNLVLDLVFIIAFDWGAIGTALATVIGQGVSFLFSAVYLYRRRSRFNFDLRPSSFRIDRRMAKTILYIGIPMSATSLFITATQVVMQRFVNSFGLVQATAYSVADKVLTLENVASTAVSQAGSTIVAQNIGAGKPERVPQLVRSSLKVVLSIAAAASVLIVGFPQAVFRIFIDDPEVIAYARPLMAVTACTCLLAAVNSSLDSVTTGTGNAKLKMVTGFLDGVVLRVMLGLFFAYTMNMQVIGLFMGHGLARLAPLAGHTIYYCSGKWKTRRLV